MNLPWQHNERAEQEDSLHLGLNPNGSSLSKPPRCKPTAGFCNPRVYKTRFVGEIATSYLSY